MAVLFTVPFLLQACQTQQAQPQAQSQPEPAAAPAPASKPASGVTYSTFINPELNIFSYLAEGNQSMALEDQLVAPWSMMIPVVSPEDGQQYVVTNCLQALSTAQLGIAPESPVAYPQFRYGVVQCMAIQLAHNMEQAEYSYLGDPIIDGSFLQQMPASSAFVVTEQDALRARSSQGSAAEISPVVHYQPQGDYSAVFDLGFGSQTVTVLARGDVNLDGTEDALLQVTNTEYNGTYRLSFLFVVTKLAANEPLQLIGGY
ncbi:hypothetical protein [Halioxenophilus aromaticivorans]|uniref:hypothetical protein n=1 Tax=Halioxenophilus aromaticivorans TaxID=1306992 RepID=UPI0031E5D0C3